jgi:hypothetical protein
VILRDNLLLCHGYSLDVVDYLISRISGVANAFSKPMKMDKSFRTLFTSAGRKQTMRVPALCRTLGYTTPADPPSRSSPAKCCEGAVTVCVQAISEARVVADIVKRAPKIGGEIDLGKSLSFLPPDLLQFLAFVICHFQLRGLVGECRAPGRRFEAHSSESPRRQLPFLSLPSYRPGFGEGASESIVLR